MGILCGRLLGIHLSASGVFGGKRRMLREIPEHSHRIAHQTKLFMLVIIKGAESIWSVKYFLGFGDRIQGWGNLIHIEARYYIKIILLQ